MQSGITLTAVVDGSSGETRLTPTGSLRPERGRARPLEERVVVQHLEEGAMAHGGHDVRGDVHRVSSAVRGAIEEARSCW